MPRIARLASGTLILTVLMLAAPLLAMPELPVKFQRLMLADGLSQSSILSMHQDSRGFVWLGTQDGLNRYDGRQIVTFKADPENPNSISDVNAWCITEDPSGDLWVGTEGGGFNRFDRQTETFTAFRNVPGGSGYLDVRAIVADSTGAIWIGTMGDGLLRFDPASEEVIRYGADGPVQASLPSAQVHSLLLLEGRQLWVGTGAGLTCLDAATGRMTHYLSDPLDECSLPVGEVLALAPGAGGGLWVGTAGGLGLLDVGTGRTRQYRFDFGDGGKSPSMAVSAVTETATGHVWVGTQHRGALQLDLETGRWRSFANDPQDPASLSDNEVYSLMMDRAGVLWIGSSNGANRLDTKAKQFFHISNQGSSEARLSNACVWSMWETRDRKLWIATESGLNILDPTTGLIHQVWADPDDPNRPSYDSFIEVVEDSLGGIWLGARDGALNRYDPSSGHFQRFAPDPGNPGAIGDDRVFAICSDRQDRVWIGTMQGLECYDLNTGLFHRYEHDPATVSGIPAGSVRELDLDSQDRLWMSIWGDGVACLDPVTGRFQHFRHEQGDRRSLSSNVVLSISSDHRNRIWLGTATGLNLLDPETGLCHWYTMEDGLPNNTIYRVEEDTAGRLWVATNFGLARFDPDRGRISNYVERDGIQDNEFNMGASHPGRSGLMYFGGINGLTAFYPDSIRSNPFVPEVALTDFRIFNKPVPVGAAAGGRVILDQAISETGHIELLHTDHVISFEFSVLHFASPLKNNFAYIMEGFETQWNEVGNRNHATYTNLPPGNYIFRVRGSNNDGVWNDDGVSVTVHVTPPFYRRAWFVISVMLLIAGTVYGAHRYRMRLLDVKNKLLERRVAERTEDLTVANEALQQEIAMRQRVEDELREARNNAVAATRAKSEFLANMSHEIRTPMNGVLGMTSILLDTSMSSDQREYAEAIYSSANNLLIIINDILDFSKIEAGKLNLETIEFDLFDVLDRVTEMLGYKAQEKGLDFTCVIDPEVPRILRGDPGRVTQILINLSNNAVKFTSEGGVAINVGLKGWWDDGVEVVFAVKDTGVGIPADRLDKIFESFTQVDASVTRRFGGTGLGLAIVRQLAELMDGQVWAESTEGQGATFRFTVRLRAAAQEPRPAPGEKMLIVTEKCTACSALGRQFEYLGCSSEAVTARDAEATLARAAAAGNPFSRAFIADDEDRDRLRHLVRRLCNLQGTPLQVYLLCRLGKALSDAELSRLGLDGFVTVPAMHGKLENLLEEGAALPVAETGPREVAEETGGETPPATVEAPRQHEPEVPLILLAEDNPINQRVASLMLKKLGYRVDVVGNGLEVLEALQRRDYDILLLDVQMPEMDGLETARRIRADDSPVRNPRIPIVALTAHAMVQDRQRSLEAGMDDHLSKPIDGETMSRVLESFLGASEQV
jgi:signal transduction histidine kinase/ligand-binding sensor domain-containing protein/CheY-like chemotaxis protein